MGNSKKSVFKSTLDFETRQLSACMAIIAEQKRLLNLVKAALPTEIAAHVVHCLQSGSRLIIYAETANWTSQIRFYHDSILNKIANAGQKKIGSLQVRICPQVMDRQSKRSPYLPSAENIDLIASYGKNLQTDELSRALSKLGRTLHKRLESESEDT